jgi:hypothetical protein
MLQSVVMLGDTALVKTGPHSAAHSTAAGRKISLQQEALFHVLCLYAMRSVVSLLTAKCLIEYH